MDYTKVEFWVAVIPLLGAVAVQIILALRTHKEVQAVKKIVNGRWSESVVASGTAGEARGNLAGRAEQTAERKLNGGAP